MHSWAWGVENKGAQAEEERRVGTFENKGKHSRAAVSVNSLPLGAAVEIDAIFEI